MVQLKKRLYVIGLSLALGCSYSQENNPNSQNLDKSNSDTIFNIKNKEDLKKANKWVDSVMFAESAGKNLEKKINPTNPLNLDSRYNYSEKDLEKFNKWVDYTLKESKEKNIISIIINKSDYALYIIEKGKVEYKYPVELGPNPYDDKKIEGDGCTPEGMYEVSKKLDRGQTNFYKGFLINYPNKEDRKANKTGGLIEIHGEGSGLAGNNEGSNWTFGCVALSNETLDRIFPYIDRNSKITIVKYTDGLVKLCENLEKEKIARKFR